MSAMFLIKFLMNWSNYFQNRTSYWPPKRRIILKVCLGKLKVGHRILYYNPRNFRETCKKPSKLTFNNFKMIWKICPFSCIWNLVFDFLKSHFDHLKLGQLSPLKFFTWSSFTKSKITSVFKVLFCIKKNIKINSSKIIPYFSCLNE